MFWANCCAIALLIVVVSAMIGLAFLLGDLVYRDGEEAGICYGQGRVPRWMEAEDVKS